MARGGMLAPRLVPQLRQLLSALDDASNVEEITLAEGAERWTNAHVCTLKPNTQRSYQEMLRRFLSVCGDASVSALTPERVGLYWSQVPRGSRVPHWSALSSFLNWLERNGWHGVARCIPAKPKARQRQAYLTAEDYPHWFAALGLAGRYRWARRSTIDASIFGTVVPCRLDEVASLLRSDCDVASALATLTDSKTGPRWIPLGIIGAAIVAAQPHGKYVFAPGRRKSACPHLTRDGLTHAFRRIVERYEEHSGHRFHPELTYHSLRHSWISYALSRGISAEYVRRIVGHSSSYMTSRYAHVLDVELRRSIDDVQCQMVRGLPIQMPVRAA